jgi:hypothetical protein
MAEHARPMTHMLRASRRAARTTHDRDPRTIWPASLSEMLNRV